MGIFPLIIKQMFGKKHEMKIDRFLLLTSLFLRSVGVILYTLLSGLSPFLDETDEETCANIMNIDFNFPESQFPHTFQLAKELIQAIFVREPK
jgi:serine/threonine protein kinase